ncbi:TauD/TfdA dioxygenase family protein [Ascoidea rubescens DSM 1968]|uniref:TauD-domain-containing protein n=1 Tax=Ascoidea rubescens DSM 1968 TaxID=1344418 RepID=A0A1D2VA98_9ASCO|nr:TauD-domain-containing protein [Ascoidea rubescens DSM 1968]ODV58606.1 TauD-domain-containing protein [Ascoidea rubescens DSM 1968]
MSAVTTKTSEETILDEQSTLRLTFALPGESLSGQTKKDEKTGALIVEREDEYKYKDWLPTWEPTFYKPLEFFEHVDRGTNANPSFINLFPPQKLKNDQIKFRSISPKFGVEVTGDVQLSQLSDEAKNELSLYVAQKGVVVFRNQDLKDQSLDFNKKYGEYFGPLHIHQSTPAPKDYPEFHLVYRKVKKDESSYVFGDRLAGLDWHSDVSYELQPPGLTFLVLLDGPETGGDTCFANAEEAYERLSPKFKSLLEGLTCCHSGFEQSTAYKAQGTLLRRAPVAHNHPIVRTHPLTGKKSLYISGNFATHINGLKLEESNLILNFLKDFIKASNDLQIRANWENGTVVCWDNRRVLHSSTVDWDNAEVARHLYRITPQAEKPF